MNILEAIIISKKIQIDDLSVKSFLLSLGLHVAIVYIALHVSVIKSSKPILLDAQEKSIALSLNSIDIDNPKTISFVKQEKKLRDQTQKKSSQNKSVSKTLSNPVRTKTEAQTLQKSEPIVNSNSVQSSEAFTPQKVSNTEHIEKAPIVESTLSKSVYSPSLSKVTPKKAQKFDIGKEQLAHIRTMIENALIYPAIAKKLRLEGVVTVSFSLRPNGYVQDIQIVSSSGSSVLDNKAIATISSLNGEYPHLEQKVDLSLPIAFSLHNS